MTWELAISARRWPKFAELDRRLDQVHDVQALEALREMPSGLLWGVGTDSPPTDEQTIGLTVAGVAACHESEEILAAFIEFIQIAASTERGWQPPPDHPDALPQLTDADFAAQARGLPVTGRADFLLLLFRIVQVERDGWGRPMIDPHSGNWTVTITREIRPFRGVADLDDYWSRRPKPWDVNVASPRPLAPTSEATWNRAKLLTAEPALLADVLLERIYDQAQPHCQPGFSPSIFVPVPCPRIERVDDQAVIRTALLILQSQGYVELLVTTSSNATGRDFPRILITPIGAAHVLHTRSIMSNNVRRRRAARHGLLAWLYEQRADLRDAVAPDNMLRSPFGAIGGQFFTASDVDEAAAYLQKKGLIAGSGAWGHRGPLLACITAEGIDRIEEEDDVSDARQSDRSSISITFNGNVTGSNFSTGGNAVQNATANGIDATGLRDVITAITEALPALGLEPENHSVLAKASDELTTEIARPVPDRSRISTALKKILPVLANAGNQALAAAFKIAIDAERAKLGLPPAG